MFLHLIPFLLFQPCLTIRTCNVLQTNNFVPLAVDQLHSYETLNFDRVRNYVTILRSLSVWTMNILPKSATINTALTPLHIFSQYANFQHEPMDIALENACSNLYYMTDGNQSICGHGTEIILDTCITYFNQLAATHRKSLPSGSFPTIKNKIFMLSTTKTGELMFVDFSSKSQKCNFHPDQRVINIVQDIYGTARNLFQNLEFFHNTYFDSTNCQTHRVNFSNMRLSSPLLELLTATLIKHPFMSGMILSRDFFSKDVLCFTLLHDSSVLIDITPEQIRGLYLIIEIFNLQRAIFLTREKRSFFELLEYSFGNGATRIEQVVHDEYKDRLNILKITEITKAATSDIASLFQDIKIMESANKASKIEINHLYLLFPFLQHIRISENIFRDQLTVLHNMDSNLNNQYAIILQQLQSYSHLITKCISKQDSCSFSATGHFCRQDCFLHSAESSLSLHYKKTVYNRVTLSHILCFHSSLGQIFTYNTNVFLNNRTHFTDYHNLKLHIPHQCLATYDGDCKHFWTLRDSPSYILQCIEEDIYATGNISYFSKQGNEHQLTFSPSLIPTDNFPIKLNNLIFYKTEICRPLLKNLHSKFLSLQKQQDSFTYQVFGQHFYDTVQGNSFDNLVQSSQLNSTSFKEHLKDIFQKIKRIDIDKIHGHITSPYMIFVFLIIILLIILFSCLCCCPSMLFKILQIVLHNLFKILQSCITFIWNNVKLLYYFGKSKLTMLYARVSQQDTMQPTLTFNSPSPPPSYTPAVEPISRPLFLPTRSGM